ncbi:GNAT family N-acetyltransferase [Herbiconiux ginsengi]|uniref:Acetyltransferase (GNAT) family protein n=1 Tax=Herbiconiux ginsengi TaxID=381665 RepID=A0A1H3RZ90_9MICO|nr:GNAT family N-acetyltransferase [Herbiconiux ginsengi]SDZ30678.1 Acetyltransferase (GNAT) family protein [Herbiconiux ginsengi]
MSLLENQPVTEEFVYVAADDELARPLLTELAEEYDSRYGHAWGEPASVELSRYPVAEFSAPRGAFVLLLRDGVPVAGGAFKTFDEQTTELKRIWTSAAHRRQGLARRVVAELEEESQRRGFRRVYLTTGPRQPEAQRLYFETGYTPLFDVTLTPEEVVVHGFAKSLTDEPLDVDDIRRRHDASLVEFYAALPGGRLGDGLGAAE